MPTAQAARRPGPKTLAGSTAAEAASRITADLRPFYLVEMPVLLSFWGKTWRPACSQRLSLARLQRASGAEWRGMPLMTSDQLDDAHTMS